MSNYTLGNHYNEFKNKLLEIYSELLNQFNYYNSNTSNTFTKILSEDINKLKNDEFSIAVIGEIKSGKSTLNNALLGLDLLGTDTLPESAALSIIKEPKDNLSKVKVNFLTKNNIEDIQKQIEIMENDDSNDDDDILSLKKTLKEIETDNNLKNLLGKPPIEITGDPAKIKTELKKYTSGQNKPTFSHVVEKVEVFFDNPLCKNNIFIVDTPGLNDPIKIREFVTEKYIRNVNAVIFCMTATQLFRKSEKNFLKKLMIDNSISKLFIVINKIDQVTDKSPEKLIEFVKTKLEELKEQVVEKYSSNSSSTISDFHESFKKIKIIPFCAKLALEGRLSNDDKKLKDSYYDLLLQSLENFLFSKDLLVEKKTNFIKKYSNQIIPEFKKEINNTLTNFTKSKEELEAQLKKIEVWENDFNADKKRIMDRFERELSMIPKKIMDLANKHVLLTQKNIAMKIELTSFKGFRKKAKVEKFLEEEIKPTLNDSITKFYSEANEDIQIILKKVELEIKEDLDSLSSKFNILIDLNQLSNDINSTKDKTDLFLGIGTYFGGNIASVLSMNFLFNLGATGLANLIPFVNIAAWAYAGYKIISHFSNDSNIKLELKAKFDPLIETIYNEILYGNEQKDGVIKDIQAKIEDIKIKLDTFFSQKIEVEKKPLLVALEEIKSKQPDELIVKKYQDIYSKVENLRNELIALL